MTILIFMAIGSQRVLFGYCVPNDARHHDILLKDWWWKENLLSFLWIIRCFRLHEIPPSFYPHNNSSLCWEREVWLQVTQWPSVADWGSHRYTKLTPTRLLWRKTPSSLWCLVVKASWFTDICNGNVVSNFSALLNWNSIQCLICISA